MKKILFTLLSLFSITVYAKPIVVVSILPQETFVQKIAKDMVDITLMVKPGNSPHSYEPKPSQMISISKADIYFSIDVEFENVWLDRFKSQNKNLKVINISDGITKIAMAGHHHHEDEHHEEESHEEEHHEKIHHEDEHDDDEHQEDHVGLDPHTWTSPKNVKIMAHNIYKALVEIDPTNKKFYKSNLETFIKEIEATDEKIKYLLKDVKAKDKFMVFHPSWGYFANEYNLVQFAVEVEGKKPKPKDMIMIIDEAIEENVKVIFTQPEFSDKSAKIIAKAAKVSVIKISPLNPNWSDNLISMAKAIANK
ncbi:MAG: zinc transport system substrate-binding protein [Sulfurimonas sp.]|jgi:zinc transport system substrate-binding protein